MEFFLTLLFLILGLLFLIKGADLLIRGASAMAKKFQMSEISIGLTVVAFGTSAPELIVNVFASVQHQNDIAFGNVIGSNLFNILLILGISAVLKPLAVKRSTVKNEIPFSLGAAVLLFVIVNFTFFSESSIQLLSRFDGLLLLAVFLLFNVIVFRNLKSEPEINIGIHDDAGYKIVLYILLGFGALFGGGKLVVDSAVRLAHIFQISEKLIALTIVAGGTSLPELATSSVAAFRKRNDLAIGNVVGSNIFNILLILGISSLIKPIQFNPQLNIDLSILIIASLMLFVAMFTGKRGSLDRWEAVVFLLCYVAYILFIFIRK